MRVHLAPARVHNATQVARPLASVAEYSGAVQLHTAWRLMACFLVAATLPPYVRTQQAAPLSPSSIEVLVHDAVDHQRDNLRRQGWAVRYRVHRLDSKEDSVRDLVETRDGNVARTLSRNGATLSAAQEQAEAARLQALLSSAGVRHHPEETAGRYGLDLIGAMPAAMEYTWVSGQPQLQHVNALQAVLDFKPRAGFQPATTTQSLLTGLAGRVWIDQDTHHLLRIEVTAVKDLNIAFGLLARVYKGGNMLYEQVPVGGGHDAYTHIEIDVRLRELMVKTVPYHSVLDASDIRLLPSVPSLQEGVTLLLAAHPAQP